MRTLFFMVLCLWCHVVDDFRLQGCMAELKQRAWWRRQLGSVPLEGTVYRHDYLAALFMHAAGWSVSVMLPLILARPTAYGFYVCAFIVNALLHAFCDHMKANVKTIGLVQDQLFHVLQIEATVCLWALLVDSAAS